MSPDVGDRMNHRRRLLDRGRRFKSGGKHLLTHRTRGHANRYQKYNNVYRHHFTAARPQAQRQGERQRREQAVWPRLKRREGTVLERGCNSTFLFLRRALGHGRLVACASCFLSVCVLLLCSLNCWFFQVITSQRAEKHERRRGTSR